tara:strand:- start:2506 stop:2700 length:195 start_codon:yes stop_codon:yes gene_type:complete
MIRKISIISFIGFLLLYYIVMITDISAFVSSPENPIKSSGLLKICIAILAMISFISIFIFKEKN